MRVLRGGWRSSWLFPVLVFVSINPGIWFDRGLFRRLIQLPFIRAGVG
jgi:hypothetical protein